MGILSEQQHSADPFFGGVRQRDEILPFGKPTRDKHRRLLHTLKRCNGSTDVSTLAVVDKFDTCYGAYNFHAMRLTTVIPQRMQHRCPPCSQATNQYHRRLRVKRIMSPTYAHGIGWH